MAASVPFFLSSLLWFCWAAPCYNLATPRPGILGPPTPLRELNVGESVQAFRTLGDGSQRHIRLERLSIGTPDVFVLRDFLAPEECHELVTAVEAQGMAEAQTVSGDEAASRPRCRVAWLPSGHDSTTRALAQTAGSLLLTTEAQSEPGVGCEDLQVLRYEAGGEYVLHHDGPPRCLTVIYYLNGVAGTWFPFASSGPASESHAEPFVPRNRESALELARSRVPGVDGLLVGGSGSHGGGGGGDEGCAIGVGDAIAFYNFLDDGSGEINWKALHAGLPSSGTKWIANHWFHAGSLKNLDALAAPASSVPDGRGAARA